MDTTCTRTSGSFSNDSHSNNNLCTDEDSSSACASHVKYGRSTIEKGTEKYHQVRRKSNLATKKCRRKKAIKNFENESRLDYLRKEERKLKSEVQQLNREIDLFQSIMVKILPQELQNKCNEFKILMEQMQISK